MFAQFFQNLNVSGLCGLDEGHTIFSFNAAPPLLLYSYIPAVVVALILGFFIYKQNRKDFISRAFFVFSIFYSFWVINIILQWIFVPNNLLYISWQLTAFFEVGLYLSALYLFISFYTKKTLKKSTVILFLTFISIIVITTFSNLNVKDYDYENCEGVIGILWYTIYIFEIIIPIIMLFYAITFPKKEPSAIRRKEIKIFSIALIACLGLFTASNVAGELLQVYSFNLFGPIGMLVFIGLVSYLIVRFNSFNVKLIASQALVWGLIVLIGSQFFFINVPINFLLNGITFIGIVIFGQSLIKSVKKEVAQRQKLEVLTKELEQANVKLKSLDKLKTEFLSLASHQLRSPLTAIQGYTSMLLEGDFGAVGVKQKEAIDRVFQSSKHLTLVVEDLLNVAKIEQGGMVYTMAPFDFEKAARDMENDLSITAGKKGLKFTFETDNKTLYMVNGDVEKIRQVILNLTDNAIKYTKEGSITIKLSKDEKKKKIRLDITDTGMGMTPEIKATLFKKFARGEGGKVNTGGSGLGLYLAKEICEAHKGKVWVESAGTGLGSTFSMELNTI